MFGAEDIVFVEMGMVLEVNLRGGALFTKV
jgi:hypothetical protein